MRANRDEIIAAVQNHLPFDLKPNLSTTELDYICGLEGEYRTLAILQAVEGQLIRLGRQDVAQQINKQVKDMGAAIAAAESNAYQKNLAWQSKYDDYRYGHGPKYTKLQDKLLVMTPTETTEIEIPPCDKCKDGWVVSYGPGNAGKYPCSCEKGQEKAKNQYTTSVPQVPKNASVVDIDKVKAEKKIAQKKQQLKEEEKTSFTKIQALKNAIEKEKKKLKECFHPASNTALEAKASISNLEAVLKDLEAAKDNKYGQAVTNQQLAVQQLQQHQQLQNQVIQLQMGAAIWKNTPELLQGMSSVTVPDTSYSPPAPKGPPELPKKGRKFR